MNMYKRVMTRSLMLGLVLAFLLTTVASAKVIYPIKKPPVTIIAAQIGETVPEGTLVVHRYVNHDEEAEYIAAAPLGEDMIAGPNGMESNDIWYGYIAQKKADKDGWKQVIADWTTAVCNPIPDEDGKIQYPWNYGYTIYWMNDDGEYEEMPDVPTDAPFTCPQ